jgi:CTP:phosphocholine cytidylyltransferase-like protein
MKKIINFIIIVCVIIGIRYVYIEYFTPKQIINITEKVKIVDLKYSFAKASIYNVIVDTQDTNREFKFTIEKSKFDELKVNEIIKINYDYAVFPHSVDTINDCYIIESKLP